MGVATVAMVDMVAMVDTVARERLRPRLLLLLSPRLMLRPTGLDMVDTAEAMEAMVATEDMLVMEAMAATVATEDMVATVARGRLRLPGTTVDMPDMAATVATEDMAATVARGRLRLPDTMVDMLGMAAMA